MRKSISLLLTSVLGPFAGDALGQPPARLEVAYEMRHDGAAVADLVHRLEHGASAYRLSEDWKGRGFFALRGRITRSSRGIVTPSGLRPVEYLDERTGRRAERAAFDWAAGTATLEHKGKTQVIALPANATDRLAFLYEFAFDRVAAREHTFEVIDGRGVSYYAYRREGEERISIPAGEFKAVKMVRHKENGERVELWLAADHALIPLRIVLVAKDGSTLDQIATRISSP